MPHACGMLSHITQAGFHPPRKPYRRWTRLAHTATSSARLRYAPGGADAPQRKLASNVGVIGKKSCPSIHSHQFASAMISMITAFTKTRCNCERSMRDAGHFGTSPPLIASCRCCLALLPPSPPLCRSCRCHTPLLRGAAAAIGRFTAPFALWHVLITSYLGN